MTDEIETGAMPADDAIVETVTPDISGETETTEDVDSSTTKNPADDSGAAPKKNRVQERIDELTRAKHEKEREVEYWRRQAEAVKQPVQQFVEPTKPTLEQCGFDDDKFEAALDQYVEQKAAYKAHQTQLIQQQHERQLQDYKTEQDFQAKSVDFANKNPDFFSTVQNPMLHITKEMAAAIKESDIGPDLLYFLGKNPEKAEEIAKKDSHRQYIELGKLQAEIATRKKPAAEPSKAPAPIKPISSKSSIGKTPDQMTDKEFAKWRREHKRR